MTVQSTIGPTERDEATGLVYRVRQPVPKTPRAVVVLLHGIGGHEANLANVAADLDPEVAVVLPRGALQLGAGQ